MRIFVCLAMLAGILVAPAPAWAQAPVMHRGLLEQLRWIEFQVVAGRILAKSPYIDRSQTSSAGNQGRQERLAVNLTSGQPSLNYELRTPAELVTVAITEGDSITVHREPTSLEVGIVFTFTQAPNQHLSVNVVSREPDVPSRTIHGATLWHILLEEPELCAEQLLPILQILRPDWNLAHHALRIEESLVRAAGRGSLQHRQRWHSLVEQLADDEFGRRQAAERQLRAVGPAVLPYLRGLDSSELDAEQRFRIRRILTQLTFDHGDDAPAQVSSWLIGDSAAWFSLLNRDDLQTRRVACEQLAQLHGGPIDFDPAAPTEQRTAQWEALRPLFLPAARE